MFHLRTPIHTSTPQTCTRTWLHSRLLHIFKLHLAISCKLPKALHGPFPAVATPTRTQLQITTLVGYQLALLYDEPRQLVAKSLAVGLAILLPKTKLLPHYPIHGNQWFVIAFHVHIIYHNILLRNFSLFFSTLCFVYSPFSADLPPLDNMTGHYLHHHCFGVGKVFSFPFMTMSK